MPLPDGSEVPQKESPEIADQPSPPELSPDVAPAVEEFMAEAAEANEAEAVATEQEKNFAATAGLPGAEFAGEVTGPYIAFDNVCKSFGEFVVLKDVSFYVNPGETLCILGRSGVG